MFKVGDQIVCLNNIDCENNLKLNKIYIVSTSQLHYIAVEGIYNVLNSNRFISLVEYRKQKLEKICSKLEI